MEASRAELAARYGAGESLRALGEAYGMSHVAIRRRLSAEIIRPGGPIPKPKPAPRPVGRPPKPKPPREVPLPAAPNYDGRSWERVVIARLDVVRRVRPRWTFTEAWHQAVKDYPVPARYQSASDTLFAEDGEAEESHAEFFERACSDAWHGLRPALVHFSPALLLSADEGFTSTDSVLA